MLTLMHLHALPGWTAYSSALHDVLQMIISLQPQRNGLSNHGATFNWTPILSRVLARPSKLGPLVKLGKCQSGLPSRSPSSRRCSPLPETPLPKTTWDRLYIESLRIGALPSLPRTEILTYPQKNYKGTLRALQLVSTVLWFWRF